MGSPGRFDRELCIAAYGCILLCVGMYISIFLPYLHITESMWESLQEIVVLEISWELAMATLDLEIVVNDEENGYRFDDQWFETWMHT